jgi:2-polyprenyl-3-methyl-5-hydroxy-6-metoxy-1,4-benzoquinol methylase
VVLPLDFHSKIPLGVLMSGRLLVRFSRLAKLEIRQIAIWLLVCPFVTDMTYICHIVAANAEEAIQPNAPPPLLAYQGRTIAQTMHYAGADWLVRESREREEDCQSLLKSLQIREGMSICDMGCGNGFYTRPLAKKVGESGRVFAVDIQPEMLHLLELGLTEEEKKNVVVTLGNVFDPQLPPESLDLVLCVDVYHEFSHPIHMLAAIRRSLKPEGQLVLVEFRSEDPNVPIKELHKMSKVQVLSELKPNGFRLVREFDELPWQHVMFFEPDRPRS